MGDGWLDVTVPIEAGMVVFPGDPPVEVVLVQSIEGGAPANVSRLTLGSHTGTHVDAPRHFLAGATPVDRLPIAALVGLARVIECPGGGVDAVQVAAVEPRAGERLLFKTRRAAPPADARGGPAYRAVTLDAARALVRARVALVGIDDLSVEASAGSGYPVHRCLLEAGIVVLEGLDLSAVRPGRYELYCLPLRIRDGDGAPARVLLRPA